MTPANKNSPPRSFNRLDAASVRHIASLLGPRNVARFAAVSRRTRNASTGLPAAEQAREIQKKVMSLFRFLMKAVDVGLLLARGAMLSSSNNKNIRQFKKFGPDRVEPPMHVVPGGPLRVAVGSWKNTNGGGSEELMLNVEAKYTASQGYTIELDCFGGQSGWPVAVLKLGRHGVKLTYHREGPSPIVRGALEMLARSLGRAR